MARWVGVAACLALTLASSAQAQSRRVLVYGDSNSWGWRPTPQGAPTDRYADDIRWPGVLAQCLGPDWTVTVDALSGRTTDQSYGSPVDSLPGDAFNGLTQARIAVAQNLPLDLVIVMLGANDLRQDLDRSPDEIARGALAVARAIEEGGRGVLTTYDPPAVLVVVPPPLGDASRTPLSAVITRDSEAKSRGLATSFASIVGGAGIAWVDAGLLTGVHGVDGVHFTDQDHRRLGFGLARLLATDPAAPSSTAQAVAGCDALP